MNAADEIVINVHPSLLEPGPSVKAGRDRKGILRWHDSALTRLELPGGRWMDYYTHADALAARSELLQRIAREPSQAEETIDRFFRES